MTAQTRQQTITKHVLPNISSKSNQTMKFGQVIECNDRNIFLKNYTQHVMEKLVPDPFVKLELSISLDQKPELLETVIVYPRRDLPNYIKFKVLITCFHLI